MTCPALPALLDLFAWLYHWLAVFGAVCAVTLPGWWALNKLFKWAEEAERKRTFL